jgi:protease I
VLKAVKHFADANKPIAAVCHGPQLLTAAGVVKGRKLNAYPAVGPEVTAAGGEYVSIGLPDAITDRNLVTGPAWTCHVEWLKQFLTMLGTRITQEEAVGARV